MTALKQTVTTVVLDLDNTLFDWVDIWYKSFHGMLESLVEKSGLSRETLISEFRKIHQRHGTSEYSFSIEELPSLINKHPGEDLVARYKDSIKVYRDARRASLKLYPGTLETLTTLKENGCLIAGYTESMEFYTSYRIRNLDLDLLLDYVYCPPDHAIPRGLTRDQLRFHSRETYRYRHTLQRYTPRGVIKPSPEILLQIIRDLNSDPERSVYVGDSLMKDIAMAQAAGITSVWASYGIAHQRPEYELLKAVTHWSKEDVARERKLKRENVEPRIVLHESLMEILDRFSFSPFSRSPSLPSESENRLSLLVEIWKKTIDVQQHFNDIEMRIRNIAVTTVVAVTGAAALASTKETVALSVGSHELPLAVLLLVGGIIGSIAFWFMDRYWYHKLLYGAVKQGAMLEEKLRDNRIIREKGLTETIGRYSPMTIFGRELHTTGKINIFYGLLIIFLLLAVLFSLASSTRAAASGEQVEQVDAPAAVIGERE